jgi:hypothetical protein
MKKVLATLAMAGIAVSAFSQGQINFHNLIGGSNPLTSIRAPIYGPEGNNPNSQDQRQGQGTLGSPFPVGSQTYTGDRLSGTGFTAELWGGVLGAADTALTAAQSGGRVSSFQTGNAAGYFTAGTTAVIDGVAPGASARLQVRAWDNRTGTITSWAQVMANPTVLRGYSSSFDSLALGGGALTPPNMVGLTSFNLFVPVPEPSVVVLGALGLGALVIRRFRK